MARRNRLSGLRLTSTRVKRTKKSDLGEEKDVVKVEVQGEMYVVGAQVESRQPSCFLIQVAS